MLPVAFEEKNLINFPRMKKKLYNFVYFSDYEQWQYKDV